MATPYGRDGKHEYVGEMTPRSGFGGMGVLHHGMRAAVFTEDGRLAVRDVPRPVVGPGQMLLRTLCCGLCGSDLYKIRHRTVSPGAVLGHEIVAVVEEGPLGREPFLPVGSRVTVSNHIPCGSCPSCLRGKISMCSQFLSTQVEPGGFAEFILVPQGHLPEGVIPLPDGISDEEALMLEPLGCCIRAFERWRPEANDRILVIGLGLIGILMVMLSRRVGAVPLGVDPLAERRGLASGKGCERVFSPEEMEGVGPVQGVILTHCSAATMDMALHAVEPGGWIGLFAGPREQESILCDVQSIYRREIDLIPSYSTGPGHMRRALDLVMAHATDMSGLVSDVMPIEEIGRAVEKAEAQQALKVVLRF